MEVWLRLWGMAESSPGFFGCVLDRDEQSHLPIYSSWVKALADVIAEQAKQDLRMNKMRTKVSAENRRLELVQEFMRIDLSSVLQ